MSCLHSSIYQFFSTSISSCFHIHTSFSPPQHVCPSISHPPLLLWVWCRANRQAERLVSTLYLPRPVGTAPVVRHASLLWHFNYISWTHSTGWTHNRRGEVVKLCPFYKSNEEETERSWKDISQIYSTMSTSHTIKPQFEKAERHKHS